MFLNINIHCKLFSKYIFFLRLKSCHYQYPCCQTLLSSFSDDTFFDETIDDAKSKRTRSSHTTKTPKEKITESKSATPARSTRNTSSRVEIVLETKKSVEILEEDLELSRIKSSKQSGYSKVKLSGRGRGRPSKKEKSAFGVKENKALSNPVKKEIKSETSLAAKDTKSKTSPMVEDTASSPKVAKPKTEKKLTLKVYF